MNSFFFLSVVLAAATAKHHSVNLSLHSGHHPGISSLANWNSYMEGGRYFLFPGDDGETHLVDTLEPINSTMIHRCTRQKCNSYWLYTRSNRKSKQVLKMNDLESVRRSNFNPEKVTIFTSHGWLGDGNTEMNVLLTKVFLKNDDVNVIVLDWSPLANTNYLTARAAVPKVGKLYGQFIYWLHDNFDLSLDNIHLVGHSLGGHVVGNAGKQLEGNAKRITALDPAGPMWYLDNKNRVSSADARYVEVIHTNAFMAGYAFPLGHSDHYPNGGKFMPGCQVWDLYCHHAMAWRYMASSVEYNKLVGNRCDEEWQLIVNMCNGPRRKMGNTDLHKKQNGVFRGITKEKYPYY